MQRLLIFANLALLVFFPIAWTLPLMRAGLALPFLGPKEISILSGIAALWETEKVLALLVALFALFAPYAKTLVLALYQIGRLPERALPLLHFMGKLSMADIFLIAIYIVVAKGVALTRVETAPGFYLFTLCVVASLGLSLASRPLAPARMA
ncbi:MAG: paraquat-inducible protein A [Pseudorhodobacter sp.]